MTSMHNYTYQQTVRMLPADMKMNANGTPKGGVMCIRCLPLDTENAVIALQSYGERVSLPSRNLHVSICIDANLL